jgi:hypothetical protein
LEVFDKVFAMYISVAVFFIYLNYTGLIYALIGILIAKILEVELNYQALVRLAVISITPVLIIDTIYSVAGLKIPLWWLICFIIAMSYMFFGIKASRTFNITPVAGTNGNTKD